MRTFIALNFPLALGNVLGRLQEMMRPQLPKRAVRWVDRQNMHLTLRFLGETTEAQVQQIQTELQEIVSAHGGMTFHLTGLGAFPSLQRPRVLWVGLDGDVQILVALQRAVEEICQQVGFEAEKKPFSPHITLARLNRQPSRADIDQVAKVLGEGVQIEAIPDLQKPYCLQEVSLIHSQLTPRGSRYQTLSRVDLKNRMAGE